MWKVILLIPVLLVFAPFELQIRFSTYPNSPVTLTHFVLWSWTWVYSFIGFQESGFITRPFYQIAQPGSLQTFFPVVFFITLIFYQLGAVSKKDAIRVGYASLVPGLFTLAMNLILSIFFPGALSINAPIPTPLASVLGIMVLRRQGAEKISEPWQSDN
jgi:hypothetical protein